MAPNNQLNRLVQAQSLQNFSESSGFAARGTSPEAFDTKYTYDPNGNLLTLQRRNAQAALMDDFSYTYTTGTNRLANLAEALPPDTTFYDTKTYDNGVLKPDGKTYRQITVEGSTTAEQGTNPQLKANEVITLKQNFHAKAGSGFHAKWVNEPNYEIQDDNADFTYDEIGNLIADSSAGTTISWTPYGKVRQVIHQDSTKVTYRYDGAGNRVEKKVISSDSSTSVTRYIRDASGNVLAIYQDSTLTEQPIYGSSRLGMYKGGTALGHETLGNRRYELSNHLGNVLAVITDNINMDQDSTWAAIESTQDYMPFGLEMEGRSYVADSENGDENYRFGFQGQEKNEELKTIHFKFREHDPKIGRFWSVDPLYRSYPGWSPYAFSQNRLIDGIELEGLEYVKSTDANGNITSASYVGYDENGNAPEGTVPSVAWESTITSIKTNLDGTSSTFQQKLLNIGTPSGNIQVYETNSFGMVELPADNPNATNGVYSVDGHTLYGFYNRNDEKGGDPEDQWGTTGSVARMINSIIDYNIMYTGDVVQIGDMKTPNNGRPYFSSTGTHHGNTNAFDIRILGEGGSFRGTFSSPLHDVERSKEFIRSLDQNGFGRIIVGRSIFNVLNGTGNTIKVATDKPGKITHENHYHVDDF